MCIRDSSEAAQQVDVMVEKENDAQEKVLEMNIDELELSVRSYNCLKLKLIAVHLKKDVYKRQCLLSSASEARFRFLVSRAPYFRVG